MPQRLKILIELQKVDSRLRELKALQGDLPKKLEALKKQINEKTALLSEKETALESAKKTKHSAELEIQSLREKDKKYRDQLFKVTTNREYDAIQAEIDATAASIDEQETLFLEASEKEETLTAEIEQLKNEIQEAEKETAGVEEELQEKMNLTRREETELQRRREELVHDLDVPIYRTYERIRKGKPDGLAVVPVINGACGGCRQAIPPQKILEIRRMNQIIICEGCGRILVWQDEE